MTMKTQQLGCFISMYDKIHYNKKKKENTTTQNLWDAAKTILRAKFIMIQSYLKKQEKHQIDNLTLYLKQLEKEQKNPPKLVKGKKS